MSLVLPGDCAVCGAALTNFSRVPVCPACLAEPRPFAAEYYCLSCHAAFLNQHPLDANGLCGLCRRGLAGFDRAYCFGVYEETLRKLVVLFKYGGLEQLAGPLGDLAARAVPRERSFDLIVPMPMHWKRRWSRGFNQSELIARVMARRLRLPVRNAARRARATPPQAGLTAAQRRVNMSGAFSVPRSSDVSGKKILLVDDVLTTGATAAACARALKQAGAASVTLVTVARADRRARDLDVAPDIDFASQSLRGGWDAQSRPTV